MKAQHIRFDSEKLAQHYYERQRRLGRTVSTPWNNHNWPQPKQCKGPWFVTVLGTNN